MKQTEEIKAMIREMMDQEMENYKEPGTLASMPAGRMKKRNMDN